MHTLKKFETTGLINDMSCVFIGKREKRPLEFIHELEETPKIVNKEIVRFYKYPQFHFQKFVVIYSRIELRIMNFSGDSFIDQVSYKELLKEALELNSD